MPALLAKLRRILPYGLIFGLLLGVYALPSDTSLAEVRKAALLRVCMPPSYPPLVTGDPAAPGIDVEILRALAQRLAVSLAVSANPVMAQDFNPRNWHVTRAQCEVLAGGVVASPVTKSFLETSPAYAETGWAFVLPQPVSDLHGRRVGVLAGISGLDRIGLGRYLRAQSAEVMIFPDTAAFTRALRDQRVDVGVTEYLLAGQIAAREHWQVEWAPAELPRYPVVLGLWKGDLTLKRAIVRGLDAMERDGELKRILARYIASTAS